MNIKFLQEIIKHIKKFIKCPKCKSSYKDINIILLATHPLDALFHLSCEHCQNKLLLHTSVQKDRKHRKIKMHKHNTAKFNASISKDEVLDMHNFLKNFNGNFIELLK